MGCGLEDDRTLQVIEQAQIEGSISFALVELPKETANEDNHWEPKLTETSDNTEKERGKFAERKRFLYAHNIIPIWFPHGKYDALKFFLSEVVDQIGAGYSVTSARNRVNELLEKGDRLAQKDSIEQAFRCYACAWEIIKATPGAFVGEVRLNTINRIKRFYDLNGYGFECKELIKEIIELTRRIYPENSIELALEYHAIGYTYERYNYYKLMLKTMQKSQEILEKCMERVEKSDEVINKTVYIYTGLAYAF